MVALELLWVTYSVISFHFKIAATALPTCDMYFRQQGSDFIVDRGTIILKRNQKQSVPADEQSEVNHLSVAVICPARNEQCGNALQTRWGPREYSVRVSAQCPQGWDEGEEDTGSE